MSQITIPNKAYVASLDVDSQTCFTHRCPDELPIPNAEFIVDELNAQAQKAQYRIGSKDAHSPHAIWVANETQPAFSKIQGTNIDIAWPQHAVPGTEGFSLIDGLPPITDYDFFVWKGIELDLHPYGACYHDLQEKLSTGLIEFLQTKQISTVIVGGLILELCVEVSALQLKRANFDVIINLAATKALTEEDAVQAQQRLQAAGIRCIDCAANLVNEQ